MRLSTLRLRNFQCFGPEPTTIQLDQTTFLLGPNGSGKTAVLQALTRLFGVSPGSRPIQHSDFHVADFKSSAPNSELWIEADLTFGESRDPDATSLSIPPFFAHMSMTSSTSDPTVRMRLTATLQADDSIEERLEYVVQVDQRGEPAKTAQVSNAERRCIEVHYLPARRNPTDHIQYSTASLMARMFRSANWNDQRTAMSTLSESMSTSMSENAAVSEITKSLNSTWSNFSRASILNRPEITFGQGTVEELFRQTSLIFSPGPQGGSVPYDLLSDGQQSLLYITLVLTWREISRQVLSEDLTCFDIDKLRPPVHMIVALEEPENSLSPQYLGQIKSRLAAAASPGDLQSVISTHSPGVLARTDPEQIRFLRLGLDRVSRVRKVELPKSSSDEAKFVREAVRAHPELYFAGLVILGEGDSEEEVLPRVLAANGAPGDESFICVVPLGGRHVHHFWKLLETLEIPYLTLLDLDCGRFQGGWGRIKYACDQLLLHRASTIPVESLDKLPKWNDSVPFPVYEHDDARHSWLSYLESMGVYFSYPLDLDLMMMAAYPDAYRAQASGAPETKTISAVLGKSHANESFYESRLLELFTSYHSSFQTGSKPASHLMAMSAFDEDDDRLKTSLPDPLKRMIANTKDIVSRINQ